MGGERRSQGRVRSGQRRRPVAWCAAWQQQRRCASSDEPAARDGSVSSSGSRSPTACTSPPSSAVVAIAWLSGLVSDEPGHRRRSSPTCSTAGPPCIGLFAVAAFALGLRSGSDGGPISLEAGDVRHLMPAPVPRRAVLLTPVVQRCRAAGLRRPDRRGHRRPAGGRDGCPDRRAAWAASGAAAGALIGLLFVADRRARPRVAGAPLGGHRRSARSSRWPRSWRRPRLVPGRGTDSAAWRCGACARTSSTCVSVAVVLAMAVAALALADRLRLEPLVAAGRPRVAAALRRHDAGPAHRGAAAPPVARRAAPHPAVVADAVVARRPSATPRRAGSATCAGWPRYPASRLVRMATLAAAAGVCAVGGRPRHDPARARRRGRALPARARRHRADVAGDRPPRPRRRRAPRAGLAARPPLRRAGGRPGAVRPDRCGGRRRGRARARARCAGVVRADGVGRGVRRGGQHRARLVRPGQPVGSDGGRAPGVRRLHVHPPHAHPAGGEHRRLAHAAGHARVADGRPRRCG